MTNSTTDSTKKAANDSDIVKLSALSLLVVIMLTLLYSGL